jgi:hypothetical protein
MVDDGNDIAINRAAVNRARLRDAGFEFEHWGPPVGFAEAGTAVKATPVSG